MSTKWIGSGAEAGLAMPELGAAVTAKETEAARRAARARARREGIRTMVADQNWSAYPPNG
jgi:hypothetical protein